MERAVALINMLIYGFFSKALLSKGLREIQETHYRGKQGVRTPMTAEDFDALTQAIAQNENNVEADAQSIFPAESRMCQAQIENITKTLFDKYNRGSNNYVKPGRLTRKTSGAGPAPAAPVETEDIGKVIKALEDGLRAASQARIEADQKATDASTHEDNLHKELKEAQERKRKSEEGH